MPKPLNIMVEHLTEEKDTGRVFDMTSRCAFAICQEGDFDIRIMNEEYHVEPYCLMACMPFVNVEIKGIRSAARIIIGGIMLEDVMAVINRTVNSSNLLAIQQSPLVRISRRQFDYLNISIRSYLEEISEIDSKTLDMASLNLFQEVIDCHSRLIVAQVIKVYFSNIPIDLKGHSNRDMIFQSFMFDLYTNCREQRSVKFYASRSSVSLKYFSTIIRQLSGTSPSELIERVVVGEAKVMLGDIHRSIKDIALSLNFPDAPTFTKYFRRVTGMSPKTFRRLSASGGNKLSADPEC